MPKKILSQHFHRRYGDRPINKLYLIVAEGEETEPSYFRVVGHILHNQAKQQGKTQRITVKCVSYGHKSSPDQLLKKMKAELKSSCPKRREAWIVMDRDEWEQGQFDKVKDWTQKNNNCYCAISNVSFEYWLLLHFTNPSGHLDHNACKKRLGSFISNYNKKIRPNDIDYAKVNTACQNADLIHSHRSESDFYHDTNGSTVYLLVNSMKKSLDL